MRRSTEYKVCAAIVAATAAYGFYAKDKINERRKKVLEEEKIKAMEKGVKFVPKVPIPSDKIVDHPVAIWLMENSLPFASTFVNVKLRQLLGPSKSLPIDMLKDVFVAVFGTHSLVLNCWLLNEVVYPHIPYFHKVRPDSFNEIFKNYFSGIFLVTSVLRGFGTYRTFGTEKSKTAPFRPLVFFLKVIITRLVNDLIVWMIHRILHQRELYFLHKKHHEVVYVDPTSNYQIDVVDTVLEGSLPFVCSLILLNKLGMAPSDFEREVMHKYIFQMALATHAGKAMPVCSTFAPLSPWTRQWDDWNPWFHANHHIMRKVNYSITPIWDWLFGTLKL